LQHLVTESLLQSRRLLRRVGDFSNNVRRPQILVGDNHVKLEALFVRHKQVQLDSPFSCFFACVQIIKKRKRLFYDLGFH